jgi:hypothetical protein
MRPVTVANVRKRRVVFMLRLCGVGPQGTLWSVAKKVVHKKCISLADFDCGVAILQVLQNDC